MKLLAILGIIVYVLDSCYAEYWCTYGDDRTILCDSCCEFDCCEGSDSDSGLSPGVVVAIVFGVIIAVALKVCCICLRVRRYQRCTTTRVVTTVPRTVVVTNQHHAGYDQRGIPTIHQPNPRSTRYNQQPAPSNQQTNPYHQGYDQGQSNFEPVPPPPYESVTKDSQK